MRGSAGPAATATLPAASDERGRCLKGDRETSVSKKSPIDESLQPKIQLADDPHPAGTEKNKLLKVSGWLGNRRARLSEHLVDKCSHCTR